MLNRVLMGHEDDISSRYYKFINLSVTSLKVEVTITNLDLLNHCDYWVGWAGGGACKTLLFREQAEEEIPI